MASQKEPHPEREQSEQSKDAQVPIQPRLQADSMI